MDRVKVQEVIKKFKNKEAIIGIVGLGYVGLPLAICYQDAGYNVVGFDIDQSKIDSLLSGKTYIKHISDESIGKMVKSGFKATTDFKEMIPEFFFFPEFLRNFEGMLFTYYIIVEFHSVIRIYY